MGFDLAGGQKLIGKNSDSSSPMMIFYFFNRQCVCLDTMLAITAIALFGASIFRIFCFMARHVHVGVHLHFGGSLVHVHWTCGESVRHAAGKKQCDKCYQ